MIGKLLRATPRAIDQLRFAMLSALLWPSERVRLARVRALRARFKPTYEGLRQHDISDFTVPHWDSFNEGFERVFLPVPPQAFLRDAHLRSQMFVDERYIEYELPLVKARLGPEQLTRVARETLVGLPRLMLLEGRVITSTNTIHTLYHWIRFADFSSKELREMASVVEWGGGYGNSARLYAKVNSGGTYTVIDTPMMSCIQWMYLVGALGESKVNLISDIDKKVEPGKVNVLPVCFVEAIRPEAELFYSTWALDESSLLSQRLVTEGNWFGAKNLLLATSVNPPSRGSDHVGTAHDRLITEAAIDSGATLVPIEFMPWSRYIFR